MAKKKTASRKTSKKSTPVKSKPILLEVKVFKRLLRVSALILFLESLFIILAGKEVFTPISIQGSQSVENVAQANIAGVTAFILLTSVITYVILTTSGWGWYLKNLQHKLNYMRWLHHGVSSGMMVALTVLLSGITNGLVLALILIVGVAVNLFGLLMEKYNERRKRIVWNAYTYGVSVGLATWGIILGLLLVDVLRTDSLPEPAVLSLYALMTVFSVAFALNMRNHYKKVGPWADYAFSEKNYILINLFAKAAFGAIIFIGFLA